ncbi:hypothetical protein IFT67_17080 [Sphingomonas sp. CFBP 13728]|uniref:hypothetical protein n=1 Tax=Sphingomonas sp. CFBP 13728 TaxID=2775294 RepID=UPI0017861F51|nr:hypothetical protein [Sphingomonas sp. CFBP 13728]MBD8620638.1 hypothetical protein [Sphingomonas sp. CFBP 13728]
MRRNWHRATVVSLALVAPLPAYAQPSGMDSFIGTLAIERGEVILTRCDLAASRYLLRDVPGAQAVTRYRKDRRRASADVMGSYSKEGDRNILTVAEFLDYQPGKSCHLSDTLDALAPADAPSAQGTPADERAGDHATPAALVGHYYLMGVMETGSELLLRPDGQFDWALSYGALDQEAQGMWHVERDEVVLVASAPSAQKPLFSYLSTAPWDEETEDERRRYQRSKIEATIRASCPIFPEPFVSATPLMTADNAPAPSATILQQRAATALRAANAARRNAELLAERLMSDGPPTPAKPAAPQVRQALSDWQDARALALQATRAAGLPEPTLADPTLPAACTMSPADAAESGTARPSPGVAIKIFDPASDLPARNLPVTMHFANGTKEKLVTGRSGFAFAPRGATTKAVSVTVHTEAPIAGDMTITFAPLQHGIVRIGFDRQQLMARPFDTLHLRIAGTALVIEGAKGRYERQP